MTSRDTFKGHERMLAGGVLYEYVVIPPVGSLLDGFAVLSFKPTFEEIAEEIARPHVGLWLRLPAVWEGKVRTMFVRLHSVNLPINHRATAALLQAIARSHMPPLGTRVVRGSAVIP